ncbi:MAG: hypothetical protein AVDCRST_MAG49-1398 [uncultured Thermomicrobiales bacterium]|uniref:Uncharacterized protein n=1 Tax=uncultured Thermomicrobiales bacterium TaxID=1645740 RepID=A0A6J4UD39_9BACT|nr:MAG: hypothetical protein AVDCRST_MAG49-1398 [uncultured Thermomicrobiales bacterium]
MASTSRRWKGEHVRRHLYPDFAWRAADAFSPVNALPVPLAEARVGLVTTAGAHLPDQEPFDVGCSAGDPTYRTFASATPLADLVLTHADYDTRRADADKNAVLPLDHLRPSRTRAGSAASRPPSTPSWGTSPTRGRWCTGPPPPWRAGARRRGGRPGAAGSDVTRLPAVRGAAPARLRWGGALHALGHPGRRDHGDRQALAGALRRPPVRPDVRGRRQPGDAAGGRGGDARRRGPDGRARHPRLGHRLDARRPAAAAAAQAAALTAAPRARHRTGAAGCRPQRRGVAGGSATAPARPVPDRKSCRPSSASPSSPAPASSVPPDQKSGRIPTKSTAAVPRASERRRFADQATSSSAKTRPRTPSGTAPWSVEANTTEPVEVFGP